MKLRRLIPLLLVLAAILFSQCRACDCGYQPKKTVAKRPWVKR